MCLPKQRPEHRKRRLERSFEVLSKGQKISLREIWFKQAMAAGQEQKISPSALRMGLHIPHLPQ